MNYVDILLFKNYKNFSWGDPFDYNDIYFIIQDEKPPIENFTEWNIEFKKNNCKDQAKFLISKSDWAVLPDVKIENKTEFENYRSVLRNYILNPVENPIFPPEPEPIWITD